MTLPNQIARASSQVWPVWLPKALAKCEGKAVSSRTSIFNPPVSALGSSALFQSHASSPTSALRQNDPSKRLTPQSISQQQIRRFSNSPKSPPEIHLPHEVSTTPSWTIPSDIDGRPVTILGAGVLGRRLAVIWASTGSPVILYDNSPEALESATTYVADTLSSYCADQGTHPGKVHFTIDFLPAISNSWMVIEAVPEELDVKISLLGRVDRLARRDCIIATNSSSIASRELVSEVKGRERLLNTLYYIPPVNKSVELLSCGSTSSTLMQFLQEKMKEVGLKPKAIAKEKSGLIFPRIWAALRRETLKALEEGAAKPEDIDELFRDFFGSAKGPCEKMDEVGLDTIAKAEWKMLEGRRGKDVAHLMWLDGEFLSKDKLGEKTGEA